MSIDARARSEPIVRTGDRCETSFGRSPEKRLSPTGDSATDRSTFHPERFARDDFGIGRNWETLMAAAQRGEPASYRRLLELLRPWLARYYRRRLPLEMVEDAVQDALIAIHNKRHTYDPARPIAPWLFAIARYKWIDRLRTMKLARCDVLDDAASVQDHHSAVISATILESLLAILKPAQRQVIRLVKLEGLSLEETAAKCGQSVPLVKVNIHRGLQKMAAVAGTYYDPDYTGL